MMQFTLPEIWNQNAVLLGIHTRGSNIKVFIVFWYQSEDRFIFILMKPKHPVHTIVFGVVTSDGDVMPPLILAHLGTWPTSNALKR